MRLLRIMTISAAAVLLLAFTARADGFASAQAQAGTAYATPQAALAAPSCSYGAALAAPSCSYDVQAALAVPHAQVYVPQLQVIQRQVIAQPVYLQRQAVVVQRQYVPVVQQAIVSPYVAQAQAQANVGYGGGAAFGLRGRQRAIGGAQRTVARSRSVTVTRRPGLLNGLLGR